MVVVGSIGSQQYSIGGKPAVTLFNLHSIVMQVHQKQRQKSTLNKIKLSYSIFCLVSGSSIGESRSIVGCTLNSRSSMVAASGQQYNIGGKPVVTLPVHLHSIVMRVIQKQRQKFTR